MSSFKIGIQTMGNKRHSLDVKESDTVLDVKKKIETELQIGPVDEQKLIYMGKILKDDQTLEAAKIKANDMLVVMIAKKKTAAPSSSSSSAAPAPAATATAATPAPAPAATPSTAAPPSTPAPAPTSAPAATTPATPAPAATAPTTTPPANVSVAASSALLTGSAREEMVQNLMGLGFPRDQVEVALRAAFNNPDRAADYLFNGIPDSALNAAGIRPGGGAGTAAPTAGTAAPTATTGAPSTTGTAPSSGGAGVGGAGLGALGGLAGLGGAGGGNEGEAVRQLLSSNPQLIPMLLQQLAQTNPDLVAQIQQNPGAFLQMLGASGALSGLAGAAGGAGAAGAGRGGGRSHVIQITPEEKQSIDNLQAMGFDRNRALEAFLLCDRNEELAANYLFENAAQFAEEDREAAAHGGGRGGGGGDAAGDDGEEGDGEDFGDMPE